GVTDDYVTVTLPATCNFFDGTTYCQESVYQAGALKSSSGTTLTLNTYACTTAANTSPFGADPFNEFGLHLLDGIDTSAPYHCYQSASVLGFQDQGRLFTSFNDSGGGYWTSGVHSYWSESGSLDQVGMLFMK